MRTIIHVLGYNGHFKSYCFFNKCELFLIVLNSFNTYFTSVVPTGNSAIATNYSGPKGLISPRGLRKYIPNYIRSRLRCVHSQLLI